MNRWRCCAAVVALLRRGRPVVALTTTEAVTRASRDKTLTYRLPARDPLHPAERALLWELGV